MAGTNIRIELDTKKASKAVSAAAEALDNPAPMLREVREYLTRSHRQRFKSQTEPDGSPWAPLSPRYKKRKKRNKNKILTLSGILSGTLRGQIDEEGLLFGTNRIQGASLYFGRPAINLPSRKWLGTSIQDDDNITRIALRYLENSLE
jgi:phage virion morphogenesis protein